MVAIHKKYENIYIDLKHTALSIYQIRSEHILPWKSIFMKVRQRNYSLQIIAATDLKDTYPSKHETLNQCWVNVGSMWDRCLRRRPNINPTLLQFLVFAGL